jgi:uncharacterized membrane protein YwzB
MTPTTNPNPDPNSSNINTYPNPYIKIVAHARELDVVCFLWALKYVKFSFFYTFRGTKSYKICDFIYHVMVIFEIYDNLWCRNWHLMWFRKDKEQRNVRMVIISIHYLQR